MSISSYWNSSASSNYPWKSIGYVYHQQLQHIHFLQAEQSLRCPHWIVLLAGHAMPAQSSGDHPQTELGCKRIISSTPCWHPSRGHILYSSLMRQMSWDDVGGIAITKKRSFWNLFSPKRWLGRRLASSEASMPLQDKRHICRWVQVECKNQFILWASSDWLVQTFCLRTGN